MLTVRLVPVQVRLAAVDPNDPYRHIDFTTPKAVRRAAKRALELMKRTRVAGCKPAGRQRAVALASGRLLGADEVRRIKAHLEGHHANDPRTASARRDDAQWLAWGGDSGLAWSRQIVAAMDAADTDVKLRKLAAFDESKHTRWPKGTPVNADGAGGGRFTTGNRTTRPGTAADWENSRHQAAVLSTLNELQEHFQTPVTVKFGRDSFIADHGDLAPSESSYACAVTGSDQVYMLAHPDAHLGRLDAHQATDWTETATHEFGHVLDNTLGSPNPTVERARLANVADARAAARTAWNNSDVQNTAVLGALREMGVTRYGLRNDREFYAEMFTAWWRQGGGDQPGNVRSAFLRTFAKNMGWTSGTPAPMETVLNSRRRRYEALLMGTDGTGVTKVIAAPTLDPDDGNLVPLADGFFFDGPNVADAVFIPAPVQAVTARAFNEAAHKRWPKGTKEEGPAGGGRFAPTDSKQEYAKITPDERPNRPRGFFASRQVFGQAQAQAEAKARAVPRPDAAKVQRNKVMLERVRNTPGARPGGELRGNAAARRARAEKLFAEFGGTERGYVPCVYCGIKTSPKGRDGHASMEQDKILTAAEGGGYTLDNLLPACRGCNAHRNDNAFHVRPDWARSAALAEPGSWTGKPLGWDDPDADVRDGDVTGELTKRTVDTPETGSYEQWIIDGEVVDPATVGQARTAAFDESKHARWPKGTQVNAEGHGGGRFAPSDVGAPDPVSPKSSGRGKGLQLTEERFDEARRTAERWQKRLDEYQASGVDASVLAKAEREVSYWTDKARRIREGLDAQQPAPEPSPAPEPVVPVPEPTPSPVPPPQPQPEPSPTAPGPPSYAEWDHEPDVPVGWEGTVTTLSAQNVEQTYVRKVGERTDTSTGWERRIEWSSGDVRWVPIKPGGEWGSTADWVRPAIEGHVDPGWRVEPTLANADALPGGFEKLLPEGDAKAFVKAIKSDKLTLGPLAGTESNGKGGDYSLGPPKPEHVIVTKGRDQAMKAIAAGFGWDEATTSAALTANNRAWQSWSVSGGLDNTRLELHNAMESLRAGNPPSTDLERGLLVQRAYTQAVLQARGQSTDIPIARFVQGSYGGSLLLAKEAGDTSLDAWPLTSWTTEKAANNVHSRFIGKDGHAVELRTTTDADAVWLTYHGEPLFRTNQLKAPGEIVVDDRHELTFDRITVTEMNGDDQRRRSNLNEAALARMSVPEGHPDFLTAALALTPHQTPRPRLLALLDAPSDPYEKRERGDYRPTQAENEFKWWSHLPDGYRMPPQDSAYISYDNIEATDGRTLGWSEKREVKDQAEQRATAALGAARREILTGLADRGFTGTSVSGVFDQQQAIHSMATEGGRAARGQWRVYGSKYTANPASIKAQPVTVPVYSRQALESINAARRSVGLPDLTQSDVETRLGYDEGDFVTGDEYWANQAEAEAAVARLRLEAAEYQASKSK